MQFLYLQLSLIGLCGLFRFRSVNSEIINPYTLVRTLWTGRGRSQPVSRLVSTEDITV
jgi:hypothetical protein